MSNINIKNLRKSYGDQTVLKGIDLEIESGEFLVLVGPSGCGKSTTLRLIAGLEEIDSGEVFINDRLVNEVDPSKRDIAMVFQNYALYPQMTVEENMAFGLKIRNIDSTDIDRRVIEASEILKIENLLTRKPKELSGGQRQRVALGRAIVRKPKVFLFDEPLSNLDAKLRQEMRIEIKKLHKMLDTTMVYVTHDQVEAMTMGDRIVAMNDGKIEQIDKPEKIYKRPRNIFTSTFIGSPQINLFEGELNNKDGEWHFICESIKFKVPDSQYQFSRLKEGRVIFGIRSEDIHESNTLDDISDDNTINADITFVEYLGSELNIHLRIDSNKFTARFDHFFQSKDESIFKVGNKILIKFNVNHGHFYSHNDQQAL